jgi:hypothetical protein
MPTKQAESFKIQSPNLPYYRLVLARLRAPGQGLLPEAVFAAMGLQRLRLRLDQGVPEWAG